MNGREERRENDLFFVCSLIEYIGRKTRNKRGDVVQKLGATEIARLLDLADILHSEPLENTAAALIARYDIAEGNFDNIAAARFSVPSHFDIAKVYKRLIADVARTRHELFTDALIRVYQSWISDKIADYNSSMFFENPQYLYESYIAGEPLQP